MIFVTSLSNAGQVRKSLSIKPLADSTGYFFQLSKASSSSHYLYNLEYYN